MGGSVVNDTRHVTLTTKPVTWDPVRRAWQQAHDAAPETCRWTRKLVADRLKEMIVTVGRTTGRIGPKEYGRGSPDYVNDQLEIFFERAFGELVRDKSQQARIGAGASTAEVTRMEQALHWQGHYLADAPAGEVVAIKVQLRCWQLRTSLSRACRAGGLNRDTTKDRIERACFRIAAGLIIDGVPLGELAPDTEEVKPPPPPPVAPVVVLPEWWPDLLALLQAEGLAAARKFIWHRVREDCRGLPRSQALASLEQYEIRRLQFHARQAHTEGDKA
jgi:hypothetical protein